MVDKISGLLLFISLLLLSTEANARCEIALLNKTDQTLILSFEDGDERPLGLRKWSFIAAPKDEPHVIPLTGGCNKPLVIVVKYTRLFHEIIFKKPVTPTCYSDDGYRRIPLYNITANDMFNNGNGTGTRFPQCDM